jgi:hypothetical protein
VSAYLNADTLLKDVQDDEEMTRLRSCARSVWVTIDLQARVAPDPINRLRRRCVASFSMAV